MQIEMELSHDNYNKIKAVRWRVKEGLFTKMYEHRFADGELPDASTALNILLTSIPETA